MGAHRWMTPKDVLALPRPPADRRIAYGAAGPQFADLYLPSGKGPFPVALLLHGGCWEASIGLGHLASFSRALAEAGIAAVNVEYRGLGDEGGGWPGTFDDVAAALGLLGRLAGELALDEGRAIVAGHSAGGHLALWLAASTAVALRGVVSIAGITDLSPAAEVGVCRGMVGRLRRPDPARPGAALERTSPAHMAPPAAPVRLLTAQFDAIVPPSQAATYLRHSRGGASHREIADCGHFELITPDTAAGRAVIEELKQWTGPRSPT